MHVQDKAGCLVLTIAESEISAFVGKIVSQLQAQVK